MFSPWSWKALLSGAAKPPVGRRDASLSFLVSSKKAENPDRLLAVIMNVLYDARRWVDYLQQCCPGAPASMRLCDRCWRLCHLIIKITRNLFKCYHLFDILIFSHFFLRILLIPGVLKCRGLGELHPGWGAFHSVETSVGCSSTF